MPKPLQLAGVRFGKLVAVARSGRNSSGKWQWHCVCDCGGENNVVGSALVRGATVSCGCVRKEMARARRTLHGGCGTREHGSWRHMLERCRSQSCKDFRHYGGRGIEVCERWLASFANFIADMGPCPHGCTLDRKNNAGNYEPGNCRWATRAQQAKNTRVSWRVRVGDEVLSKSDASRRLGISARQVKKLVLAGHLMIETEDGDILSGRNPQASYP